MSGESAGLTPPAFLLRFAEPRSITLSQSRAIKGVLMKIVLLVVGLPFIVLGLFWFGQGTGLLQGPHNAVLIDAGAGVVALGIGLVWFALR
jgi:hypothetical protein